ncbi:MAG: hypothetical protein P0S94_02705 [Simkaniaceae bacterium]|nr:hypothetical protein [Simkaniaceae bacterium]
MTPDLIVFKGLIASLPSDAQIELLKYTTEKERTILSTIHAPRFDPTVGIAPYDDRIKKIHHTWIVKILQDLPAADRPWLIAPLPKETKEKITKDLPIKKKNPSPFAQKYLAELLYTSLTQNHDNLLPEECLPMHPLNDLLDTPYKSLIHFIDYLGLHDLSAEMKTMIHTKNIRMIEAALKSDQKTYLRKLLGEKEPVVFSKINLNDWDGNEEKLRTVIHQRGLNRLAKALYGANSSLIWHLTHRLDLARANFIETYLKDIKNRTAHEILLKQTTELLQYLKEKVSA